MTTITPTANRIIHKYVLEVRHDFGHIYWDRCGRVVNDITRTWPEWAYESMQSGACVMRRPDDNCVMTFGFASFDLSQTQDSKVERLLPLNDFAVMADELHSVIQRILELEEFARIGFRVWSLYPTSGREEADSLLCDLKHFRIDTKWGRVYSPTFAAEIERKDKLIRVSLSSFEQMIPVSPALVRQARLVAKSLPRDQRKARIEALKAQHKIDSHPQFGILLDMDASIEDPDLLNGVSVADFMLTAGQEFDSLQKEFLERKQET